MTVRSPWLLALFLLWTPFARANTPAAVETELKTVSTLVAHGKYPEALEHLKADIKAAPDQVPYHLAYIELLITVGQRADAQRVYKTLVDRDPKQPTALFLYGKTLDTPAERAAQYQAALAIEPRHPWAHLGMAAVAVAQDHLDEAVTSLRAALATDPTLEPALEMLATIVAAQGKTDEAIQLFMRLEAVDGVTGRAPAELGRLYAATGRPDEALAAYQRAAALQPENPVVLASLAQLRFARREYAEAHEAFAAVARLEPGDDYSTVMVRVTEEVADGALAFETVAAVQEAHALELREPAKAMAVYQKAVKTSPDFVLAQLGYGRMLLAMGDTEGAAKALKKALELTPDLFEAHMTYAELMVDVGAISEAEKHLVAASHIQPLNPDVYMALGVLYTKARNAEGAEEVYRKAIPLLTGEAAIAAQVNLSGAIAAQGRLKEAVVELDKILDVLPNNPDLHLQKGRIFLSMERFDDAAAEANRALKINSKLDAARDLLDQVDLARAQYAQDMATKERASQILVSDEKVAKEILSKLKGGADFEALARAFSHGPEAIDGGDLGFFSPDELAPPLAEALAKVQVGQLTGVVKTDAGYHILKRTH